MPDSRFAIATPTARGADEAPRVDRLELGRGIPLLATEPMTVKERDALRALARALRVAADQVDEAIERNLVTLGLQACDTSLELGLAAAKAAVAIGGHR